MADAPLGAGDGAQKRRVVVVVDQQPQPGAQVLDFGAVKKALAARDLVGNLRLAQCFFEGLGLMVGAVEHRKVFPFAVPLALARPQALDARDDALGLVLFVVAVHHPHRFALAQL